MITGRYAPSKALDKVACGNGRGLPRDYPQPGGSSCSTAVGKGRCVAEKLGVGGWVLFRGRFRPPLTAGHAEFMQAKRSDRPLGGSLAMEEDRRPERPSNRRVVPRRAGR